MCILVFWCRVHAALMRRLPLHLLHALVWLPKRAADALQTLEWSQEMGRVLVTKLQAMLGNHQQPREHCCGVAFEE